MPDSPIFARDDCDTFPSAAEPRTGKRSQERKNNESLHRKVPFTSKGSGRSSGTQGPYCSVPVYRKRVREQFPVLLREMSPNNRRSDSWGSVIAQGATGDLWGCAGAIGRVAKKTTGSAMPSYRVKLKPGSPASASFIRNRKPLPPVRSIVPSIASPSGSRVSARSLAVQVVFPTEFFGRPLVANFHWKSPVVAKGQFDVNLFSRDRLSTYR